MSEVFNEPIIRQVDKRSERVEGMPGVPNIEPSRSRFAWEPPDGPRKDFIAIRSLYARIPIPDRYVLNCVLQRPGYSPVRGDPINR